jgi:hypothetical protein
MSLLGEEKKSLYSSLRGALQQVQDKLRDVAIPNLRLGDINNGPL